MTSDGLATAGRLKTNTSEEKVHVHQCKSELNPLSNLDIKLFMVKFGEEVGKAKISHILPLMLLVCMHLGCK